MRFTRAQGDAWFERGLLLAAKESRQEWCKEARARDHSSLPAALNALGSVYIELGMLVEAVALFDEVWCCPGAAGTADQVRAGGNLSLCHYLLGESGACIERGEEARALKDRLALQDHPVGAQVELVLGLGYIAAADWGKALEANQRALRAYRVIGDQVGLSSILNNLGLIYVEIGEYELAEKYLRDSLHRMPEQVDATPTGYTLTELGRLKFRQGDLAGALRYGSQALGELWNQTGLVDKAEVARLCELFGSISDATGDRKDAVNYLQRAITYYAQRGLWREWSNASKELDAIVNRPVQPAALARAAIDREDHQRLRYLTTLLGFMDTLESLYPDHRMKAELVTRYSLLIGQAYGMDEATLAKLSHAARLHDIGLTTIPEEAASGDRAEDEDGFTPLIGERVLSTFGISREVRLGVKHHRERYDGRGGPDGLRGEEIPIIARIIAVAEGYVRTVIGPDHGGSAHLRALQKLTEGKGARFDPTLVELFVGLHQV